MSEAKTRSDSDKTKNRVDDLGKVEKRILEIEMTEKERSTVKVKLSCDKKFYPNDRTAYLGRIQTIKQAPRDLDQPRKVNHLVRKFKSSVGGLTEVECGNFKTKEEKNESVGLGCNKKFVEIPNQYKPYGDNWRLVRSDDMKGGNFQSGPDLGS